MVSKRRSGLGSGLGALIPTSDTLANGVRDVAISQIRPNQSQPRTIFDEQALEELAASIREHGLIQPLIVTERMGEFELIAGERRWRAAQRAGLERVPVVVREATPQQLLELALVENLQRADLNPIEEGKAYQTLKDSFTLSDEQIAKRVGKSRVAVANARRLLNLSQPAQEALLQSRITAGHGRAILMVDTVAQQNSLLELVRRHELSVRATEDLAQLAANEQLDQRVRSALLQGTLSPTQAQALLRLGDQMTQSGVLDIVLVSGVSVRETERLCELVEQGMLPTDALAQVRGISQPAVIATNSTPPAPRTLSAAMPHNEAAPEERTLSAEDAEVKRLFEQITTTPVQLVRTNTRIRVTFEFYNDDQLEGFYELLVAGQGR